MIPIVFTRPADWVDGGYTSDILDLHHVPIGGDDPRRNSGKRAGDGIGVVALPEYVAQLEATLRDVRPAIFLFAVHQHFDKSDIERCRQASPDTVWVLMQNNQPCEVSRYVMMFREYIDIVAMGSYHVDTIRRHYDCGISVITGFWDGYTPGDHVYKGISHAKRDCFFGGYSHIVDGEWRYTLGPSRYQFMTMVNDKFDLLLCGLPSQWPFEVEHARSHYAYLAAMQTAKITLGYNHYDLTRYYTRRTIHSGASGRLLVTRYIPGMENDFGNDTVVWFNTNDEGITLVDYYLQHVDEREQRARRQQELFEQKHTWEARLRRFEELAEQIVENGNQLMVY